MDAFDGCDYDLLDVMDPWGCSGSERSLPLGLDEPFDGKEAVGSDIG